MRPIRSKIVDEMTLILIVSPLYGCGGSWFNRVYESRRSNTRVAPASKEGTSHNKYGINTFPTIGGSGDLIIAPVEGILGHLTTDGRGIN